MAMEKNLSKIKGYGIYKGTRFKGENRRFCSLKGQMFLIASIIIVIALIAMKNLFGIYVTAEEKRFAESSMLDKQLKNIKNEFSYATGIASLQSDANFSGIDYLYNLSNFLRNDKKSEILYLFVFNNGSNQKFSATVGNFLNDKINVTLNATSSTPLGFNFAVSDKKNVTKIFQSTVNGTVALTLKYGRQGVNATESMEITTGNNLVFGFFDIRLEDSIMFVRSKSTYNWSWTNRSWI